MSQHRTINAVDVGADATGATDSTEAINATIRHVHEAGGGTVHLPAGAYRVSAPFIELLGGVHLQGAGRESTIIFADTGAGSEQKTAIIHAGTWLTPRVGKDTCSWGFLVSGSRAHMLVHRTSRRRPRALARMGCTRMLAASC